MIMIRLGLGISISDHSDSVIFTTQVQATSRMDRFIIGHGNSVGMDCITQVTEVDCDINSETTETMQKASEIELERRNQSSVLGADVSDTRAEAV